MRLLVKIEGAEPVAERIWLADVPPEQLKRLSGSPISMGRRSVVVVKGAGFNHPTKELTVDLENCALVNLGRSLSTVFVDVSHTSDAASSEAKTEMAGPGEPGSTSTGGADLKTRPVFGPGDDEFLRRIDTLEHPLPEIGRTILSRVRTAEPGGNLELSSGGRYVERPRNFWTIRPQPVDRSYAITVYGEPKDFASARIDIKPDRGSYSRFKVSSPSEVDDAVRIILQAKRLRELRGRL